MNNFLQASYGEQIKLYHIICYIIIGAGFLMTFIGFLGCCGAFQESRVMVGLFFAFLLLVFAAQIVGGALAFINRETIRESVTDTMKEIVQNEYGRDEGDWYHVDFVQSSLHCCGANGPTDWHDSYWQRAGKRFSRVPDSCCRDDVVSTVSGGLCGVGGSWVKGTHRAVWSDGCGPKMEEVIYNKTKLLMFIAIGLGVLEILSLILALLLCCGLQQRSSGGYKA